MSQAVAAEPIVAISSSPSSGRGDGGGGEREGIKGLRGTPSRPGGLRGRLRSATKVMEKVEVAEEEGKEEEEEEEEEEAEEGEKKEKEKEKEQEQENEKTVASRSLPTPGVSIGATNANEFTASSSFVFPVTRIRRIVGGSDDRGRAGTGIRPNHEAIFLINKAAEFFINLLATDAYGKPKRGQKRNLAYKDLSSMVSTKRRYEFLSDFVPEKLKAEDALKARASLES